MNENQHSFSLRIYYEDTDAGGIVYNANYLKYVERARTEWLRELGISQSDLLTKDIGFVVRKVQMDNLFAGKLDDQLTVVSTIKQLKKASIIFSQDVYNQINRKLCTIEVLIAFVDLSNNQIKPCALPQEILGALPSVS
jgi:acyl-CoA thioester hydrolase